MLKKIKSTVKKAVRYDPFGSIDAALQDQQSHIDELQARVETLSSIQEWYDIATRHFGVGIAVISRTRQVLWSNAFLTEMVGNTERGFCHAVLCDLGTKCPSCAMEELLSGSIPKASYSLTLQDRNARPIPADATAMPMIDTGGVITGIVVLIAPQAAADEKSHEAAAVAAGIIPADLPMISVASAEDAEGSAEPLITERDAPHCPVNMNTIIEEYLTSPKFLRLYTDHPFVCFTNNLESALEGIAGSPVALMRGFNTLLTNAAEGVNGIGEVHIRTRNVGGDDPAITHHELPPGDYIAISISEAGDAEQGHSAGEGHGRDQRRGRPGIESAKTIAREHQGRLILSTIPGKGTMYTLYLPVRLVNAETSASPTCSGKKILVIDDMTDQRALAATILRQLGYSVTCVRSGEDAIGHLARTPVDLVLLNMIMFGMDGLETYRGIMQINPDQKVLLVSGYSVNSKLRETRELSRCRFIKKPYRLEILGPAVAQELGLEGEKKPTYQPAAGTRKFPPI